MNGDDFRSLVISLLEDNADGMCSAADVVAEITLMLNEDGWVD